MNRNHQFQEQDTVSANPPIQNDRLPQSFDLGRQTISLEDLRLATIDSTRLEVKKVAPVVKTSPFIPENDSIDHPGFNVFTGDFDFPDQKTLFDQFRFEPFDPSLQEKSSLKKLIPTEVSYPLVSGKEDVLSKKIEASKRVPEEMPFETTDWMLGIILVSLLLFGWIRVGYGKYVQMAVQASYNFFSARRIKEEANILRSRVFYFLNILFFINLSLFITQFAEFHQIMIPLVSGIGLFFIVLAGILLLYSLKGLLLVILDFLFLAKGAFTYYNATVFIYNRMIGLFLLPIITVIPFISQKVTPWLFYSGFFIIAGFYIFRIFRGLQIGFKNRLSIFYLILYLCALEILPVWVLYHWVKTQA